MPLAEFAPARLPASPVKPDDPQPDPVPPHASAETVDSEFSPAVAAEFAALYLADCGAEGPESLVHYLERFAGFESTVRAEYERLQGGEEASAEAGEPPSESTMLTIGRFRLRNELGRGGQAVVYRAFDPRLRREVALKVLPRVQLLAPQASLRFEREARVAARLEHPSICRVFDSGVTDDGVAFIAMQFLSGQTLREWSANVETRDQTRFLIATVAMIEAVARALHYAHQHGVLHRDIKPGNIMLTEKGEPVLLDFGLAALADQEGDDTLTLSSDRFGTPAYMAPEQLLGPTAELGPETDVYALGLVLFELLSGCQAAGERSGAMRSRASILTPLADVRRHNRLVSADLAAVVGRATAPDRSDRYASAIELADELRRVDQGRPVRARQSSLGVRLLRWAQRNPAVAGATGAVFAATAIGLVVALLLLERASDAEEVATAERDVARWSSYVAQLPAAQRLLDVGQVSAARLALDRAPVEHRSVGWHHIHSVVASHRREWFGPGPAVVGLGANLAGDRVAVLDEGGGLRLIDTRADSVTRSVLVSEPVTSARIDRRGRAVVLVGTGPERRVLGFTRIFGQPEVVGEARPAAGQRLGDFCAGPGFGVTLIDSEGVRIVRLDLGDPDLGDPDLRSAVRSERVHGIVANPSGTGFAVLTRKLLEQRGLVRLVGHDLAIGELQVDEEVDGRLGLATWAGGRDRLVTTVTDVYDQRARAILWDVVQGQRIATQSLGRAKITAVSTTLSGGEVLLGDAVGRLHVLDSTLRPKSIRYGHTAPIREILPLAGGLVFTASADGRVLEWRLLDDPRKMLALRGRIAPSSLAFDRTGGLLAVGSANARLEVVDVRAGSVVRAVPVGRHTRVAFAESRGRHSVSIASRNHRSIRRARLEESKVEVLFDAGDADALSPCMSPDGRSVFVARGGQLVRFDLVARESRVLEEVGVGVSGLVHAEEAPVLAWSGSGDRVAIRRLDTGETTHLAEAESVEMLAIDRNGEFVAIATRSAVRLEACSGTNSHRLPVVASSLAFSPDSRRLLVGLRSREVAVFDVTTGAEIMRFAEFPGAPTALAFDPAGGRLAVGCTGGWLVLLRVGKEKVLGAGSPRYEAGKTNRSGLDGIAQRLAFPRDNQRAAKDWLRIEDVLADPFTHRLWHEVAARAANYRLRGDSNGRSNLDCAALGSFRLGDRDRACSLFEVVRKARPESPLLSLVPLVGGVAPAGAVTSKHELGQEARLRIQPDGESTYRAVATLLTEESDAPIAERMQRQFGDSPSKLSLATQLLELDLKAPEQAGCFALPVRDHRRP